MVVRFVEFTASTAGRAVRVVAGIALIAIGAAMGGGWWALAVVGLLPLAAGVLDVCVLAPLAHQPLSGRRIRARQHGVS